ncbi:MAG: NAD(P)H-dependent oxidoreductase subunit E [Oscillospiraceae bacterium]|nr:NAD(P)H-dependent oxidoreductase subunit E [Oscillospiraceae bacterium]
MDFSLIDSFLEEYKNNPEDITLIMILQKAQDVFGWLPPDLLEYISDKTGIPLSEILGVSTFYHAFRDKPVGKHQISLCQGTACHVNGSSEIERILRDKLGVNEGEVTPDGLFSYNNVACLGCCSLSPAMMIKVKGCEVPTARVYGKLTSESIAEIIEKVGCGH